MKLLKVFYIISLLIINIHADQNKDLENILQRIETKIDNLKVDNLNKPSVNNITVSPQLFNKSEQNNIVNLAHYFQTIVNSLQDFQKKALARSNSIFSWIKNHKFFIFTATAMETYLYFLYRITKLKRDLKNEKNWSSWKQHITFKELLSIPQEEITKDLIMDIQKKYPQSSPTNFVEPLIIFSNDIDKEILNLNQLIQYSKIMRKFRLQKIYLINDDLIYQAQEKIQKLTYIKNIFSSWSAEFRKDKLLSQLQNSASLV